MDKEILTFGNTEIEKKKKKNYRHNTNKISFGEKKCK